VKKISLLSVALLAVAPTFFGCSASLSLDDEKNQNQQIDPPKQPDPPEPEPGANINWNSENGTLEVVNNTNRDIVVFQGQTPQASNILGGIRALSTKTFDISDDVPDFEVGGFMILRGVSLDQYEANKTNLSAARIDFSAMATYRGQQKFRVAIESNYVGDNGFIVSNRGRIGMELRKDGPDGEKVSYLPALQQEQIIYTSTTNAITLFPVYVFYNRQAQSITTVKATSLFETVTASPRPISANQQSWPAYYFPNDPTVTWEQISGQLTSPVAYVKIAFNVTNQSGYVTVAGTNRLYSQDGYNSISGGETLTYEIEGSDEGIQKAIIVNVYGGLVQIPARFDVQDTPNPLIENGYDYDISVDRIGGNGQNSADYKATITKRAKRDISHLIETL